MSGTALWTVYDMNVALVWVYDILYIGIIMYNYTGTSWFLCKLFEYIIILSSAIKRMPLEL